MALANQSASTDVNIVSAFLAQDGHLPGIFAEFGVAVDVGQGLDASGDAERIAAAASTGRVG